MLFGESCRGTAKDASPWRVVIEQEQRRYSDQITIQKWYTSPKTNQIEALLSANTCIYLLDRIAVCLFTS
jgi:hypothetical protein